MLFEIDYFFIFFFIVGLIAIFYYFIKLYEIRIKRLKEQIGEMENILKKYESINLEVDESIEKKDNEEDEKLLERNHGD